jgi:hypothetical protein
MHMRPDLVPGSSPGDETSEGSPPTLRFGFPGRPALSPPRSFLRFELNQRLFARAILRIVCLVDLALNVLIR